MGKKRQAGENWEDSIPAIVSFRSKGWGNSVPVVLSSRRTQFLKVVLYAAGVERVEAIL
jgi:hypothetical protein